MGPSKLKIRYATLFYGSLVFFLSLSLSQNAWADRLDIHCPAGDSLNDCVAEACANPEGGDVHLDEGVYDANITAAINIEANWPVAGVEPFGLCSGGVSIIGRGIDKTILVSTGPKIVSLPRFGQEPFVINFPQALGIGSPGGQVEGPSEVQHLTIRCDAGSTCPAFGVGINNHVESGAIRHVRVEGFRRGIQLFANNGSAKHNILTGTGAEDTFGRGIFVITSGFRLANIDISHNIISNFWRGIVVDSADDVQVTHNIIDDAAQGIFTQLLGGPFNVSHNYIAATDVGVLSILNAGDPDGSGDQGRFSNNLLCGSAQGFAFFESNTDLTVTKNVMLGTPRDSGFVFDDIVDPSEITLDKNLVLPQVQCPL